MTGSNHKYEIFIRSSLRATGGGMMQWIWSWRKRDSAGFVLVRGTDHGSMVDCLRAAWDHRGKSDNTSIAVELEVTEAPDAVGVVYLGKKGAGDGTAKQIADSGFGARPAAELAGGEASVSFPNRLDAFSLYEREQRYVRREEDARNRAAQTEDSDLRNEFLQSARIYAELIGSLRRERGTSH
jgi:hypothetical protein